MGSRCQGASRPGRVRAATHPGRGAPAPAPSFCSAKHLFGMGRAAGAVYLLLAAAVAATAVGAAVGGATPLAAWRPARRLLAIMQTFMQPSECQMLPESDVLSALATIDSQCPQAPPYVCGSPGAPCFDSLAKASYAWLLLARCVLLVPAVALKHRVVLAHLRCFKGSRCGPTPRLSCFACWAAVQLWLAHP